METLYDTRTVGLTERFDHYRDGAANELAPVEVRGPAPGRLLATMTVSRIGDFDLEELIWEADAEIVTRRTERLIRVGDPERYRLLLTIAGELRLEQADSRVRLRPGDIGLYDLSRPWRAVHPSEASRIQAAMLTFPRAMLPVGERALQSLIGTLIPPRLPGHSLMGQLLRGLPRAAEPADYADALAECTVGLIRHRLGLPGGSTPQARKMFYDAQIRDTIRKNLHDPELDPNRIARDLAISPRYLYRQLEGTGLTPTRLLKRMRMDEGRRWLEDPALHATPVREIAAACGYRRPDQFAHDFQQTFGIAPTRARAGK